MWHWARSAALVVLMAACAESPATLVPNDIGHLWKISRAGTPDSFVFGTIHVVDPRVATVPPPVHKALARAQTLAVEMVPEFADTRTADFELLEGGARLEPLLDADLYRKLHAALVAQGIAPSTIERLKPWAAMMKLGRAGSTQAAGPNLDAQLLIAARANRMKVLPLEMLDEQIAAFDTIPLDSQIALLRHALLHRDALAATVEPTIVAWQRGHLRALEAIAGVPYDAHPGMGKHRATLIRNIIENRTVLMHHRLDAPLRGGRVFIAIGAMHLAGPRGLLELLRADGYLLTPIW